jgi:hypothetical protein
LADRPIFWASSKGEQNLRVYCNDARLSFVSISLEKATKWKETNEMPWKLTKFCFSVFSRPDSMKFLEIYVHQPDFLTFVGVISKTCDKSQPFAAKLYVLPIEQNLKDLPPDYAPKLAYKAVSKRQVFPDSPVVDPTLISADTLKAEIQRMGPAEFVLEEVKEKQEKGKYRHYLLSTAKFLDE